MKINKKLFVVAALVIATTVCAAAASSKSEPEHYKNLKVLPQNISSKDLQGIMVDDFQDALGVTCDFCHAASKDGHGLDFVSDAKPEKEITRNMMRMNLDINKKYFKLNHPLIGSPALIVTCNTCHKGAAFPEGAE
ncbi:MAG: c-type cytochrome [Bacteroidetes bacterium]|nr:c-type cytochrome [Bacteroidota bacterium]